MDKCLDFPALARFSVSIQTRGSFACRGVLIRVDEMGIRASLQPGTPQPRIGAGRGVLRKVGTRKAGVLYYSIVGGHYRGHSPLEGVVKGTVLNGPPHGRCTCQHDCDAGLQQQ